VRDVVHRPPDPEPNDVLTYYETASRRSDSPTAKARSSSRGRRSAVEVYGVEGPGVLVPDLETLWEDSATKESLLRLARDAETDPQLLLLSAHLLAVSRAA